MALAITGLVGTIVGVTLARLGRDQDRPKFDSNEKSIEMVANMNKAIRPCDDFYEFACGNFAKQHPRKEEDASDYFRMQSDRIENDIVKLLTAEVPLANQTDSEAYMRELYRKCIDDVTIDNDEFDRLRSKINSVFNVTGKLLIDKMASVHRMGLPTLVAIAVIPNPFDTSKHTLVIDHPGSASAVLDRIFNSISYKALGSEVPLVQMIIKSLKLFENITDHTKDDELEATVLQILHLAKTIAWARTPCSPSIADRFHRVTLANLSDTGFDWQRFIQATLARDVDADEEIIVGDLTYVKKIASIVKSNEASIEPYLKWSALQTHGAFTGRKFRDILFEFLANADTSFVRQSFIDKICRSSIDGQILGRMYVKQFVTQGDKKNGQDLIEKVTESFRKVIVNKNWMDEGTKSRALIKLDKIKSNVGYPDWVLDDDELQNEFPFMSKGNFSFSTGAYQLASSMIEHMAVRKFDQFGKSVDRDREWPISPVTINAVYHPLQNTITIPASLLRGFFFSNDYPDYVNYGQLASIIGHELTHAFDNSGSQFDENGNMHNWWSNATRQQFNERARCMIDQYSKIEVFIGNSSKHIKGEMTIGENIADNGGVREAFKAWSENHRKESERPLDGLEIYSPEQLFFIAYANNWCGDYSDEMITFQLDRDSHPPAKYRVNVPLANYGEFARAFGCSAGCKMNPVNKCQVW